MNFEFAEESIMLRDEARDFLSARCGSAVLRDVVEGRVPFARALWGEMATMGWIGAAIPEAYGGAGLGYEVLCVLAEELGRVIAPVPFASSLYLASETLLAAATEEQCARWLPSVASGETIGTVALAGLLDPAGAAAGVRASGSMLSGSLWPVPDGPIADFMIVAADDEAGLGLYHVALDQPGVTRRSLTTFDPSRGQAAVELANARGERLDGSRDALTAIGRVLDRAAILTAFEQVGGAQACLEAARDYAMDRIIFGRPLASFQATKHKLADIFVSIEIARSNAYHGAWALSADALELPLAAATARLAAIEAFHLAAKENIQVHGGSGFTWEFDCHLFYRRAKLLALSLGSAPYWADRLIDRLDMSRENAGGF